MITDRYKLLIAVEKYRSISAAAENLGYTPSGVSRMISTMEDEAGVPLFFRSKHGVTPTEECLRLLPPARSIVYYAEQYDQIAAELRGLSKGTLTIGNAYSSYYSWLSQIIADFNRAYPHIDIKMVQKNSTHLTEAVMNHETDIGIVSRRDGGVDWTPLTKDPMVAWVPKDSKYMEMGYVPIEAFAEEDFVLPYPGEDTDTLRVLNAYGITPNVKYTINDNYAAVCLVEAGLGITLLNNLDRRSWDERIGILPIKPEAYIDIGIISNKNENLSPAAKKFIEFLKERINV